MSSSSPSAHARAIAQNLLNSDTNDIISIRHWLKQEGGAEANIKAVVSVLVAHPKQNEAKVAAEQLQSALNGTGLADRFNVLEMLSVDTLFAGTVVLVPRSLSDDNEQPVFVPRMRENDGNDDWDMCE
jgi:hypothetical protein